ncbi:unnamed protein product (macronuclear) [Paramecium tetraurelia]|uniref:Uncharacterized protein n=1 Tax=Paramecium tetraurelia TaxID=5888 RepID=A0CTJ5_PARTE|nr:uncharacterized protein GSPATT00010346001 [Paramecium tetraurelia]CAK74112.1 unnamed protein product [Paramecium tetraurelia]|eukprot:XP_001441509.1 hypothetical protein (macronuclear) [Paramecium tetraurelia strain d4-2]
MQQYDELLAKLSKFVDHDKGKDFSFIINSAFDIYSKINANISTLNDNEIIDIIQKRFFIKQQLKQNKENEGKYINYFKEINQKLKSLQFYQQIQIQDLLVEADAETLEQVYHYVQNQTALQFQFQFQEQRMISDQELNNYFLTSIQISEQILSDKTVVEQFLNLEDKNQYIQNKYNEIFKFLESYQISFGDNINNQDQKFIMFKQEFINQLKQKFWIFEKELCLYCKDDQLNNEIKKTFNQYYKSICLKLPFKQQFQELIKIIIENDKMEGIVERILDFKISTINKYVLDHIAKYNIPEIDKKLEQLYQKKKQKYLIILKNTPIYLQQVDIVITYCNKISTMIALENSQAIVDFTNSDQLKIIQSYLSMFVPNYEYLNTDEQYLVQLFQETNTFCPDLSILKSTQFLAFSQKIQFRIPKQEIQIELGKQQDKEKLDLKYLNYEKLDIKNVLSQYKDFDQLPSLLYENRIWDQYHKLLISECVKFLDEQQKQRKNQRYNEQKKKLKMQYEMDFFIPFGWIENIFLKSYDESKEEDLMKKIDVFFLEVGEDEEEQLKALRAYGDIEDNIIKNRKQQIREYFHSLNPKNYQSIEELKKDVIIEIQRNREQQFKQFYELKNLIDNIDKEYLKKCQEIFIQPPSHFVRFKVDKQTQSNDIMDINNKILSFYNEQLLNCLKYQLDQ